MTSPVPPRPSGLRGPATAAAAAQVFVHDLDSLEVTSEDAHHLSVVLRLRPGEAVVASDGAGGWRGCRYRGQRDRSSDGGGLLEPDGATQFDPRPERVVSVGFVPVKGERPEWVVQKLTEVGVDRMAVVRSARAVVRWEGARAERALTKLRTVVRHAAAQSRRAWLPEVLGVLSLDELGVLVAPGELALAHPGGTRLDGAVSALAVGPEGGWDPEEVSSGRPLVGLSNGILRAETAAIAAGALMCSLRDEQLNGPRRALRPGARS